MSGLIQVMIRRDIMGVFDVLKVRNGVAQGISYESCFLGEGHYSGHVNSSRLPHGHGVFVNSVGIEYDGEWMDGKLCGYGKKYAKGYYDVGSDDDDAGSSLVYAGDFTDDKFNGKGKQFHYSGRLEYDGDFNDGWKQGHGTEFYENGTVKYEGEWFRNRYNGKGIYHCNNGDVIDGKWTDGLLNGEAVLKKADGSSYKRLYDNDHIVKEEILTAKAKITKEIEYDGGDRYEGEVNRAGLPNGKGVMYYSDGSRHEGEYKNGNRNGHGVFYYSSGDKYDGDWKDGLYDGHGIICYQSGDIFECDFVGGKENGDGIYICTDGRIMRQVWDEGQKVSEEPIDLNSEASIVIKRVINYSNGNKYEGEVLLNGERHGHGLFTMKNGDKYDGEWEHDIKHGHGIEIWATGAKFEGDWNKGKKNGEGMLTNRNGLRMRQVWENGKLLSQEAIAIKRP